jgi:hypothetical protein
MSTLLKDLYSLEFYNKLAKVLHKLIPQFDKEIFVQHIFDKTWASKELKERMRHTTLVLHNFFPKDFAKSSKKSS